MDLKTVIIVVLGVSILAWFTPTPGELQTRFKSGQDFYAARDYARAMEQFDAVIGATSRLLTEDSVRVSLLNNELNVGVRTAAYYQKGNALRNMGRKDSAVALYRIVEKRSDSPRLSALAQYQIYEIYYTDKNYPQAISEARSLVENHPTSDKAPQALYDIGWCFRELKMLDSSDLAFETLIEKYPDNELDARARYQVAENYFEQKEWDHAIEEFRGLITRYRPDSFAKSEWENVELKALRDRKLFEAVSSKDVDLTTLELTAKAQVRIGDAFRSRGLYDSAMVNYRKVVTTFSLMPTLVEATIIKMAEYTTQHAGLDQGIVIYRQAIDEHFNDKPLQAKLQYKIARTFQEQKLYARASDEYMFYATAYAKEAEGIKFPVEQAMFLACSNSFNARDYNRAIIIADSMLVLYPRSDLRAKVLLYHGLSRASQFKFADARIDYEEIVRIDPESNEALIARTQLGKSYLDEKRYAEAVKQFELLLAGDRSRLDLNETEYFLGLSYYGQGNYADAIRHLEKVQPGSSYFAFTLARIARAYAAQKDIPGALAFLDKVAISAGKDSTAVMPFVRLARAELYSAQQQYSEAVEQFDDVVSDSTLTENTRMQALYGRGLLLAEIGKHAEAARDLSKCLASGVFVNVFPALIPTAKEKLAFADIQIGKKAEGKALLDELVNNASTPTERSRYLAALTEFHFRGADYPKAIETGGQVIAIPDAEQQALVRSYIAVGNSYGNLQQPAKAMSTMRDACVRLPDNPFLEDTFFHLAGLYYTGGDYGNAVEAYRSYLEKFPAGPNAEEAHFLYGLSEYSAGLADSAIVTLRRFLAAHPQSKRAAEAQMQVAEAYFNTRRFSEASREFQLVYQRFPEHDNAPLAMLNEGWSYYQSSNHRGMLETFGKLIARYPKSPLAADAAFSIGDYYYNNKSYDSALVAYQVFAEKFPENARVEEATQLMHELSQVEAYREYETAMEFFEAKNWNQAVQELEKVMTKYPSTDVVYGCKANMASALAQKGDRRRALTMFTEIIDQWKDIEAAKPAVFFAELHKRWIEAGK